MVAGSDDNKNIGDDEKETRMTRLGDNIRLTVSHEHRGALRQLFSEGLGCEIFQPPGAADLEIYRLAGGGGVGVYYVEPEGALAPADLRRAAWLEFRVEDPEATAAALAKLGLQPFDYEDRSHRYYAAPGGQVFRLAATKVGESAA